MKKNVMWRAIVVATVSMIAACELMPLDDGGGGGVVGGNGLPSFQKGFVYIRSDNRDVYVADDADVSEIARLTTSGSNRHPSLSNDGRRVVFIHGSGANAAIQTVPVAGGAPSTVLTADSTKSGFSRPVFSPDDETLAFTFERGGASYVGIVNADGSGFEAFGNGAPSLFSPTFYPDGQNLLVASTTLQATRLVKLNLATGAADVILSTLGNDALGIASRVVLSPSGTHAAFDGEVASGVSRIFAANLGAQTVTQLTDYTGDPDARDSFPSWNGSTEVTFSSDNGGADQVYGISPNAVRQQGSLLLPSAVEAWYGPN
ncbi:MAG: hypothetical protein WBV82_01875 [Myxococcaceae bacterium]